MMTKLATTAVRDTFSETVNRVAYRGERIALERHGRVGAPLTLEIQDTDHLSRGEAVRDPIGELGGVVGA